MFHTSTTDAKKKKKKVSGGRERGNEYVESEAEN
jgi:hypothetical protein